MRPVMLAAALALGACTQPIDIPAPGRAAETAGPAIDDAPILFYTAGPGEVMVVNDPCADDDCPAEAAGAPDRYSALVYLGMRAPDQAVFERIANYRPDAPLATTPAEGLLTPVREDSPPRQAEYIPARPEGAPTADRTEIVVNPVAGVSFGTDAFEITIASATPARVVYTVTGE